MRVNHYLMTRIYICPYCGKYFTKTANYQKYCCKTCSKYARQDNVNRNVKRWKKKHEHEVPLGTTNIREHPNSSVDREEQIVSKELSRVMGCNRFFK